MMRRVFICLWLAVMPLAGAAQDGADALFAQALRFHEGDGVLQDHKAAAGLLLEAAKAGHSAAQNMLGRYLFEGLGVAKDVDAARRWLEAAAEGGAPEYLLDLAQVLETDPETLSRAAELYRLAADAGYADAAVSLGVLYQEGRGVAQDFDAARLLYEGPAAAGHPRALNNLGLMYVRAQGVERDYARAATLFSAAAEKGLKQAMTNLGVLYENGFGVPLDETRAAELYRAAGQAQAKAPEFVWDARITRQEAADETLVQLARSGDPIARLQWSWLALNADTDYATRRQAALYVRAAAEQGHGPSMFNLGLLFMRGDGVAQDFVEGYGWLLLAQAQGVEGAQEALDRSRMKMTAGQINDAQQHAKRVLSPE